MEDQGLDLVYDAYPRITEDVNGYFISNNKDSLGKMVSQDKAWQLLETGKYWFESVKGIQAPEEIVEDIKKHRETYGIKKKAEDVQAADMVDIPEGDITPDDIMEGEGGGDFAGGDMGGGDGMDFADDLDGGPGGAPAPQDPTDWNKVKIFPTGNLDEIINNQEDFEIDFSRLV